MTNHPVHCSADRSKVRAFGLEYADSEAGAEANFRHLQKLAADGKSLTFIDDGRDESNKFRWRVIKGDDPVKGSLAYAGDAFATIEENRAAIEQLKVWLAKIP